MICLALYFFWIYRCQYYCNDVVALTNSVQLQLFHCNFATVQLFLFFIFHSSLGICSILHATLQFCTDFFCNFATFSLLFIHLWRLFAIFQATLQFFTGFFCNFSSLYMFALPICLTTELDFEFLTILDHSPIFWCNGSWPHYWN